MDDWDRPQRPAQPRRLVAVGAILILAVVGGVFVRAGVLDRPGGSLDVDRDAGGEAPLPDDAADETPAPEDGPAQERGSVSGDGPGQEEHDGAPERGLPPDGAAQGELADGAVPGAGSWELLPEAPIGGRAGHTLAWSGDELLVWGGVARHERARGEFFSDGAAYAPETGRWRDLARPPLDGRSGHGAAWTGTELVVWGGVGPTTHFADGAAYDPDADAWRVIAASPLSPRQRPATVWTGDELLVLGGADHAGALRSAAAYAPGEDSWRRLADLPEEIAAAWELDGAWVGDAAVVWAQHADRAIPGARFDPATDTWEMLPPVSRRGPVTAAWTGEELLALRGSDLVAWRPGDRVWEQRQAPWGSSDPWINRSHWTGEHLVVVRGANQPRLDVYDPATDTWEEGPALPAGVGHGPSVWSGTMLLTWGGNAYGPPGREATGAVFLPGTGG